MRPAPAAPQLVPASLSKPAALTDEQIADRVAKAKDAAAVDRIFAMTKGPQMQSDIVLRALGMDKRAGAALRIRFLKTDPPLFFRATALDALGEPIAAAAGFGPSQDFAAPVNQRAAGKLTELLRAPSGASAK